MFARTLRKWELAALYFAWCEEKVEDKVLVEVQNESLF
jgi:hypothetical protein